MLREASNLNVSNKAGGSSFKRKKRHCIKFLSVYYYAAQFVYKYANAVAYRTCMTYESHHIHMTVTHVNCTLVPG